MDEVGVGPLAGPVTAAAVCFRSGYSLSALDDSKQLAAATRYELAQQIESDALAYAVGWANVQEIDRINVLNATHLAMRRAISQVAQTLSESGQVGAELILVDGNKIPPGLCAPCIAVVKGDRRVPQISAASILAKVARDAYMLKLHTHYPQYGFAQHKGYPTKRHCAALETHGAIAQHRRSYAPVQAVLER